jgi:purine-binding chemotaxis protein CheW
MQSIRDLLQLVPDSTPENRSSVGSRRVCLITLEGKFFAIDLRQVREVFELQSYTPVPGMPAQLIGVANLRGTIVPLADVRTSLGISQSTIPRYVLVVRHGSHQVGLLIDEVPEILTIYPGDILDSSAPGPTNQRQVVSGLIKAENRISPMLEVSELLTSIEESTADVCDLGRQESERQAG